MVKRWEWPTEPDKLVYTEGHTNRNRWLASHRPTSDIAALMQLAPGQTQHLASLESQEALKETVGKAVDGLDPEDRWIFEALLIQGVSLRTAARVLGIPKSSLARRRDRIKMRLMSQLVDDKVVQQWRKRDWDQSS